MDSIHLNIGELVVTSVPSEMTTILGSCVSVCLYTLEKQAGGMIHFSLPSRDYAYSKLRLECDDLRFGTEAIPKLVEEVLRVSALGRGFLKAKVVGGAAVVDDLKLGADIGEKNIQTAFEVLKEIGIPIVSQDVGGKVGRKVIFYPHTGRLRVAPI
jgi:chemotaxis protein CheD